jgi:hypothetical protein
MENWNPSRTYTWTLRDIKTWLKDAQDFKKPFNGSFYEIKSQHVMAGMYRVWFVKKGL